MKKQEIIAAMDTYINDDGSFCSGCSGRYMEYDTGAGWCHFAETADIAAAEVARCPAIIYQQIKGSAGMKSQAQKFRERYSDVNELMTALDQAGVESEQDFEKETTTWTFDDGSEIVVCGQDVSVQE